MLVLAFVNEEILKSVKNKNELFVEVWRPYENKTCFLFVYLEELYSSLAIK